MAKFDIFFIIFLSSYCTDKRRYEVNGLVIQLTNPRNAAHVMAVMNFLISFELTCEFVVRVARTFFSSNSIFIVELLLLCLGHQLSD